MHYNRSLKSNTILYYKTYYYYDNMEIGKPFLNLIIY